MTHTHTGKEVASQYKNTCLSPLSCSPCLLLSPPPRRFLTSLFFLTPLTHSPPVPRLLFSPSPSRHHPDCKQRWWITNCPALDAGLGVVRGGAAAGGEDWDVVALRVWMGITQSAQIDKNKLHAHTHTHLSVACWCVLYHTVHIVATGVMGCCVAGHFDLHAKHMALIEWCAVWYLAH